MAFATALKQWFKQTPLFNSSLFRYRLAPVADRLLYELKRRQGRRPLGLTVVGDVRPLAEARGWPVTVVRPSAVQIRRPSRTIAEDTLDIIRNGNRRVQTTHETRLRWNKARARARGEMYYSHLYAHTRYPVLETFTCSIPQALVAGRTGLVVTPQLEVLAQSSFDPARGVLQPIIRERPAAQQALPGRYVSLISQVWTTNYSHWLIDSLVRLAMIDPAQADYKVILPHGALPFMRESLTLLGIGPERQVELPARQGQLVVEELLLCVAQQRATVSHADYVTAIRDRLLQAATGRTRHPAPWRRIYISRASSARKVVNEAELLPVLQAYGFEVVRCEELTMSEQIRLFSEATAVVGAHGAGMINPIFANPGAIVLELYNRLRWNHCICRVQNLMGHQHWHLFGEDVGGNWDTYVEPSRLRKVLRYALEGDDLPDTFLYDEPF
ncbi:MAG: glycosyltransferase family 61 protein [Chloroflexales bacterium]|nr:glycosyltransferase family 61 protein [Chloroflexales bacterium]